MIDHDHDPDFWRFTADGYTQNLPTESPVDLSGRAGYEREDRCPKCDSDDLESVSGDFPTGVVAPDGGAEIRYEEGWRCLNCGIVFDAEGGQP